MTADAPGAAAIRLPDWDADDARFRLLANRTPVMIWRADGHGACDFFNTTWLEFTGRSMAQEVGEGWAEGVHPEDIAGCVATYQEAFAHKREYTVEYRLRRHDGEWRCVLVSGRPFKVDGAFAGYIGSCFDITEARKAMADRQRALEERETLLNELHHRVKNNAQATTSFLGLQANRASDPSVAAALRGAATRVMLATLVQDRMFRVRGGTRIDIGIELPATARAALDVAGRPGIGLEVIAESPLPLPVAQATPLALIVNELVVNAARHGFPDGRAGTIRLTVRRESADEVAVEVSDDGIGLPALPARSTPHGSLGLHLIPRLARQAHASLALDGAAGTRATLRLRCA